MRLSWPMPRRTSLTSAPAHSQRLAISLMKLIFVDKQGVGHVLGHLGALGRHGQQRLVGPQVGLVEVGQHVDHLLAPRADHHAIGLHEVVDRHPFLEKLGIAGHVDVAAGQLLQPRRRPWRWCPPARCSCRPRSTDGSGAGQADRRPSRGPRGRPSRHRPAACPRPGTPAGPSSRAAGRSVVKRSRPPATLRATSSASPGS